MTGSIAKVQEILSRLDDAEEPYGLSDQLTQVPGSNQVIFGKLGLSDEFSVTPSIIRDSEIGEDLFLVSADESGAALLRREDYLPSVEAKVACRMAHANGCQVYIAPPDGWHQPEAVIVTSDGICLQLLAGEHRQKPRREPDLELAHELRHEQVACISAGRTS